MNNWRELKELIILGKSYKIKLVPLDKLPDGTIAHLGQNRKEIWIWKKIKSDEDYQEILLHEILHSLLDVICQSSNNIENSEGFVSLLSQQLYDTLKRNNLLNT